MSTSVRPSVRPSGIRALSSRKQLSRFLQPVGRPPFSLARHPLCRKLVVLERAGGQLQELASHPN